MPVPAAGTVGLAKAKPPRRARFLPVAQGLVVFVIAALPLLVLLYLKVVRLQLLLLLSKKELLLVLSFIHGLMLLHAQRLLQSLVVEVEIRLLLLGIEGEFEALIRHCGIDLGRRTA